MIQIYADSIIPPLKLIFETSIKLGHFPEPQRKYYSHSKEREQKLNKQLYTKITLTYIC